MKSFIDFVADANFFMGQNSSLSEAVTQQARIKKGRVAKRNKKKLERGRDKYEKITPNQERVKKRSRRDARKEIEKKFTGGKNKAELSPAQKQNVEKQVDKKQDLIKAIAKRKEPNVRKRDAQAKKDRVAAKNTQNNY
jgi:hypothetical protein